MDSMISDLQLTLRRILQRPGFAFLIVLVLALGIGANTALWSVVDGVLLRDLPYPDPDRLVMLLRNERGREYAAHSPADLLDFREKAESFENLAGVGRRTLTLAGTGEPERLQGASVSSNFFDTLAAEAARGRTFTPDAASWAEEARGLVISNDLWQRRLGSARDVVGTTLQLDGEPYTVLGVMPPEFAFPEDADFWVRGEREIPAPPGGRRLPPDPNMMRGMVYFPVIGRLAPGVSPAEAQAEIDALAAGLLEEYPDFYGETQFRLVRLNEHLTGDVRGGLWILLGAVALVLLIACANVANLLLARGASRQQEMAIRGALGASRKRLLRQEITESLLLALLGGALGALLATVALRGLLTLAPDLPRLEEVTIDARVLAFTLALSLATGLLFGLLPALQAARVTPQRVLREGGSDSGAGSSEQRLRSFLVAVEVALALVILIGAGLMLKSLYRLRAVDPGFRVENVLAVTVNLPPERYPEEGQRTAFYDRALERLAALPGVRTSAMALSLPMSGIEVGSNFMIEGRPQPESQQEEPIANLNSISPEYFDALGIPVVQGRAFTAADRQSGEPVAVVSESLVRRYFPDENPLGQRLAIGTPRGESQSLTIVGVVGDVRQSGLEEEPTPTLYMSHAQNSWQFASLVVRTEGDPLALSRAVREAVFEVDPNQAVHNVASMEQRLARTLEEKRFMLMLLSLFAALALLLAGVGVYGLMSYTVARRGREIGIRMALGARAEEVLRLVVRDALRLVAFGLLVGLLGAFALTRFLATHLYDVSPTDPSTFGGLALLLTLIALAASYLPAQRAAAVDPIRALRHG